MEDIERGCPGGSQRGKRAALRHNGCAVTRPASPSAASSIPPTSPRTGARCARARKAHPRSSK
eukprot:5669350-Prymnesium_polylepis.1